MYLIDKPFVSKTLIETIKTNAFEIIDTSAARELVKDDTLKWIDEQEAIARLKAIPETPIYSNSENALSWINQNLGVSSLARNINIFKDKLKFRALIKDLFPDFHFEPLTLEDIQHYPLQNLNFPFVIKPAVGFFSIGVHIIENEADWNKAKAELQAEKLKSIFPKNVLDTNNFMLEDFIPGEEYAIDYYHNDRGEVVLLNVMHHLFSSGTDTSDRVYSTSKSIIHQHKASIEQFLSKIGTSLQLKNFPAHAEVRIDSNGKIVPIEINPLRFGGWCTTGDLLDITLEFNSTKCFFENRKPNWDTIFEGKEDKKYSIVILDNSTGVAANNIEAFDYEKLAADFENPILVRKLDFKAYPLFGFVFTETSPDNQKELQDILSDDLKKYI